MTGSEKIAFVYETLVGIASREESLGAIIDKAAEMMGRGMAYIGAGGDVVSVKRSSDGFAEKIRFHPVEELRRLFLVIDVEEGKDGNGHLVLEEAPDFEGDCVPPAKLALLVFHAARGNTASKIQKYAENFLQRLPDCIDAAVLKNDFSAMKVDFRLGIQVVAGEIDKGSKSFERDKDGKFLIRLDARLRNFSGDYISRLDGFSFIAVISPSSSSDLTSLTQNAAEVCTHVATMHYGIKIPPHAHIAFGRARQNPFDIAACGKEALIALRISAANRFDRLITKWDELGSFKLIGRIASDEDAACFCKETLKRLILPERGMKELLATLVLLEENNWNHREAARKMFYHHNTIKHRREKIQEIIEGDLSDSQTRFNISLALRIFRSMPDEFL
jgi:hypothetical protein